MQQTTISMQIQEPVLHQFVSPSYSPEAWAQYEALAAAQAQDLCQAQNLTRLRLTAFPLTTGPPPATAKLSWASKARMFLPPTPIQEVEKDLSYQCKRSKEAYILRKAKRNHLANVRKYQQFRTSRVGQPRNVWQVQRYQHPHVVRQELPKVQPQTLVCEAPLELENRFDILADSSDVPMIVVEDHSDKKVRRRRRNPRRYRRSIGAGLQKLALNFCIVGYVEIPEKRKISRVIRVVGHVDEQGAHQEPAVATTDGSDNVIVQSTTDQSVATPTPSGSLIKKLCSSTARTDFSAVSQRATVGNPFEWKSNDGVGTILKRYVLPLDFVKAFTTHAQMSGFRYSQYWRGNIVFLLTIAANPMVTGMCQVAWFYGFDDDFNRQWREHPVSYSMANHGLLNAATANDVKLVIPYKCIRSYLQTTTGGAGQQNPALSLGQVIISVLNPLGIPQGCTPKVMLTPQIWFEDSDFIGMKSSDYGTTVTGQSPVQVAQMIYRMYQVYQDYNRDKEINPSNPASMVLRHGNLASGTGQNESLQPMRLHAGAQSTHPELTVDQMQVDFVKRVFGFVQTIKWKSTQNTGDLIFAKKACPLWDFDQYQSRVKNGQDIYYIPPVAFLATMYREWRGSLELRGDIVATRYHVGKMLISYLPGHWGDLQTPTLEQLRAGITFVIALSDGNAQFSVNIPFIYDTPFCPTPEQSKYDATVVPGMIFASVLTPLSTTCVVSPDVDINLYIRGGEDFEVAIPRSPSVGLCFDVSTSGKDLKHEAKSRSGYIPVYLGVWHNFLESKGVIWRWGTLSDRVGEFDGCEDGYYYKPHASDLEIFKKITVSVDGTVLTTDSLFYVPYDAKDGDGLIYMGACKTEDQAKLVWCTKDSAGSYKPRGKPDPTTKVWIWEPDYTTCIQGQISDGGWTPDSYVLRFTGTAVPNFPKQKVIVVSSDDEEYDLCGHVNNERQATTGTLMAQTIGPQSGSMLQFGERFADFKDIVRRYYFWTSWNINLRTARVGARLILPLNVAGHFLETKQNPVDNLYRDGLYSLVASQYRFFRGGLRVKLLFSVSGSASLTVLVCHRPDVLPKDGKPLVLETSVAELTKYEQYPGRGFAETFTITRYNPCIEIEVPYYLRYERGYLQQNAQSYQSWCSNFLGSLQVMFLQPGFITSDALIRVTAYVSAADDMRFDEYQGHPPVLPIRSVGAFDPAV